MDGARRSGGVFGGFIDREREPRWMTDTNVVGAEFFP
jgi:hypothetical protein